MSLQGQHSFPRRTYGPGFVTEAWCFHPGLKGEVMYRAFQEPVIIPITIRPGVEIHIQGVPYDLTREEAERVAKIIIAFSKIEPEEAA